MIAVAVTLTPAALAALTTGPQFSALTNLYTGTNGPSWAHTWPTSGDACTFYGVTCDAGNANVRFVPKSSLKVSPVARE